ncbi:Fibronectin type III domain protein [Aciduliprofundum boonei T469]|nr:Fibronectin type III domain protein [Aciduliprofundum boonei T469]
MLSAIFMPFVGAVEGPQGLTATYSNGNVTLSWSPVANATLYKIYRGLSSGNESYYANTTNTTYIDTNVTVNNTYYYYVTAIVGGNETNKSQEVFIKISSDNSGGGGGNLVKKYLVFNSYMLYTSLFLLAASIPLYAYGEKSHKDVAKYGLVLGFVLLLVAWGTAYFNTNIQNITLFNQTLNTLMVVVGVIMLIVGVVLFIGKSEDSKLKEHFDVAKFSAAFGIFLLFFAWLIQYIVH